MQCAPARRFEDLQCWQKAHAFALEIYRLTNAFPKSELFGLTAQVRRAAVSVAANIAEGFEKRSRPEKARFMNMAQGSLQECRYYLILVNDLNYCNVTTAFQFLNETGRLLDAYTRAIRNSI